MESAEASIGTLRNQKKAHVVVESSDARKETSEAHSVAKRS